MMLRSSGTVHLGLEGAGAGLGDHAEVVLRLLHAHADAVILDGDGARILVGAHIDAEVGAVEAHLLVRQGQVAELVDGVGSVGDDLTQEDLLVGVYGVDHQIKEPFGFCFELLFRHF